MTLILRHITGHDPPDACQGEVCNLEMLLPDIIIDVGIDRAWYPSLLAQMRSSTGRTVSLA